MSFHRVLTITCVLFSLLMGSFNAHSYSVKGQIVDATDNEPCAGATYKIYLASDTIKPVIINVADLDGFFQESLNNAGEYLFETEYIGLLPYRKIFKLDSDQPEVSLGVIRLNAKDETLSEVVVTAKKKLVQSDGATLTYNVEDDPESTVSNTIDMLRKVPMVSVDAEDNIKINGDSNFKILVNGKEDPMLSGDVKNILKALPASTIKKIEVITEPGAKYDAEGTGGILNIVTVGKQTLDGYSANISLRAANNNFGGSVYGRFKVNKVTASANFNYIRSIDEGFVNKGSSLTENLTDDNDRYQFNNSKSKNKFDYLGGNINLSWEPDTLNLFTIQGNVGKNRFNQISKEDIFMQNIDYETRWSLKRENLGDYYNMWLGANASFQHTFKKSGHHLIFSYIFGYGDNDITQTTNTYDLINYQENTPWRSQINSGYTRRNTFQIDYANPINSQNLIEAGFKGNWIRNFNNSSQLAGSDKNQLYPSADNRIEVMQFQDIMAAYLSYTGNYGKWNMRVGVRYEYTRMGLDYTIGDYTNFTTHLNDVVPNLAVSYRISDASNLRLAYQMRISRPEISQLNPYVDNMNINTLSYGNPDLDSERSNSVSLTYSNYGGKIGGSLSIAYDRNDNMIANYSFMENNILNTTYANIGHSQNTRANLNLQWTIVPMLNLGVFLSGRYVDLKADTPLLKASNSGWTGNYNLNADYSFPFKLRLSVYGGGGTGWIDLQSKGSNFYYYGLSLSRSFFKNDLMSITAYGQNFITPYQSFTNTTTSDTFRMTSEYRYRQWSAGISLTFKFGQLHSDVKRTSADLEMIDGGSMGGDQNNMGSGRGM